MEVLREAMSMARSGVAASVAASTASV
jgi:hypothetical protein